MLDLTGKTYGMLTVIKRVENHVYSNGESLIKWLCRCSCGNEVEAIGKLLKNGSKKSCGCNVKNKPKKKPQQEKKPKVDRDNQKFMGILGSIKHRKKCYIHEMARALTLRYGVEDLKEWVQDEHMLDTLAAIDPDIEILLKYLYKNTRLSFDYQTLFKGMNLKEPATKAYCINLAVREMVLSALQGTDLEEEYTDTAESEDVA